MVLEKYVELREHLTHGKGVDVLDFPENELHETLPVSVYGRNGSVESRNLVVFSQINAKRKTKGPLERKLVLHFDVLA